MVSRPPLPKHTSIPHSCCPGRALFFLLVLPQRQGKQPDFKMRDSKNVEGRKTAVWIEDRKMPAWAKANLQMLPGGQPYALPPFIPESAMSGSDIERQWVNVFTSYSSFWDNRVNVSLAGWRGGTARHRGVRLHTCAVLPSSMHVHHQPLHLHGTVRSI